MKPPILPILLLAITACTTHVQQEKTIPLAGTWQLVSSVLIERGDTTVTDHLRSEKMIKIINQDHFAFLRHDLAQGKDSTALYVSGGGRYTLEGDQYTEYLEFCTAREWEGHTFQFIVSIQNDTLIQQGRERIESLGVDRLNTETYVRL